MIEIRNGEKTIPFLESVWSSYRKNKKRRKFAEVIEMLTIAELPIQPLEVQLAQVFIILENLKSTYAKVQDIPFYKGYYRELSDPIKPLKKEKKIGFEKLLSKMLSEVGMRPGLKRVIKLRNEIIHFGLSRKPFDSLSNNYDFCQDIIREYLLRIMKYEGEYLVYSKACRKIDKIK